MIDRISPSRLAQLQTLIAAGREAQFYWWPEWCGPQGQRSAVLEQDRRECQMCRARGRHSRATIVHHVKHLRDRPDLALSVWDPDTGERQLLSVCKACHEREHPESFRQNAPQTQPLTTERWD